MKEIAFVMDAPKEDDDQGAKKRKKEKKKDSNPLHQELRKSTGRIKTERVRLPSVVLAMPRGSGRGWDQNDHAHQAHHVPHRDA